MKPFPHVDEAGLKQISGSLVALCNQWGPIMLTTLLNAFIVDTSAHLNSQLIELKELRRRVQESSVLAPECGRRAGQEPHFSATDLFSRETSPPTVPQ
jgi:hypothetical protein